MNLYEDLKWRGLLKDISSPKIEELLNGEGVTFYIGTDPTGDSLHIGHFSSFLIASRLKKAGHHPILLIGGATGQIGDPKPTAERAMITKEAVAHNVDALTNQVKKIFGFEIVNNYDWSKDINFIDYLRDYGKYFSINYMLDKDIIKRRLDAGITYTEFSYMIMQSLDFMHLFENKNCLMQIAGQDQWGNITAGIELIRKKLQKEAYAFTMPLVTKKDGTKFGKSESGTIWLDPEKTSSYELYQFFLNSEDEMVIDYLKRFTFLTKEEIEDLERKHKEKPELREAAKTLAYEVVKFVHGVEAANNAKKTSEEIFSNGGISANMPSITIDIKDIENKNILDLLVLTDIASSKSEARRLVTQGGISLNKEKVLEPNTIIDKTLFNDNSLIIQKGKKTFLKVNLKDS